MALAAAASLVLAACGGDDDGGDGEAAEELPTGEASGEFEFFSWWTGGGDSEGKEALLELCAAGRLASVKAPGSGISDDKLVHAHVDELVSFSLDEEPLLPSIPSRLLDADTPLDDLVVKPRGEMGGEDVVIWRDADAVTRERVAARVAAEAIDLSQDIADQPAPARNTRPFASSA